MSLPRLLQNWKIKEQRNDGLCSNTPCSDFLTYTLGASHELDVPVVRNRKVHPVAIPKKLPIEFSCGHTETKDLSDKPAGKRKAHAFGLGKNFVCSRCFKKQGQANLQRQEQEVLADAMGFEEDHELPELQGSDKQIKCATLIRYTVLADILGSDEAHRQQSEGAHTLETAKRLIHAGRWIDNLRDTSDLDTDDVIELITTGVDDTDDDHIASENPF